VEVKHSPCLLDHNFSPGRVQSAHNVSRTIVAPSTADDVAPGGVVLSLIGMGLVSLSLCRKVVIRGSISTYFGGSSTSQMLVEFVRHFSALSFCSSKRGKSSGKKI
jgi:hypothetical protein